MTKFLQWNANVLDCAMNIMDAAELLDRSVELDIHIEQSEKMFFYRLLEFMDIVDQSPSAGTPGFWSQAVHYVLSEAVAEEKTFESKNGMRQIVKLFRAAYESSGNKHQDQR